MNVIILFACDQCAYEWWWSRKPKPVEKVADDSRSEPWVKVNSNPYDDYDGDDDDDDDVDEYDDDDDDGDGDGVKCNPDKTKVVTTTITYRDVTYVGDFDTFSIQQLCAYKWSMKRNWFHLSKRVSPPTP